MTKTSNILKLHTRKMLQLPDDLIAKQPLLLFDGDCTLCSNSVRFLLRHNFSGNLKFTSLQSGIGLKILNLAGKDLDQADTLQLLQDNKLFGYSTAALMITAHLSFPWYFLRILIFIPSFIRDAVYRFIAKNRYKWFGRKSFCLADEKEYRERFLS